MTTDQISSRLDAIRSQMMQNPPKDIMKQLCREQHWLMNKLGRILLYN